jgi:hypothetical protein
MGTAYEIGPDGTTFNQPVTISVTYDEASLTSGVKESDLKLGTVTNNQGRHFPIQALMRPGFFLYHNFKSASWA